MNIIRTLFFCLFPEKDFTYPFVQILETDLKAHPNDVAWPLCRQTTTYQDKIRVLSRKQENQVGFKKSEKLQESSTATTSEYAENVEK